MIQVEGLSKDYGPIRALDNVGFEIATGEVVAFLGPNGAGKTTTLRILAGYLSPTSGKVKLGGVDAAASPLAVKRLIGYLPENNPLYEEMEVTEYLEWAAQTRGFRGPDKTNRVRKALELCGLGPMLGRDVGQLSKGYRQRVGLAQAILHDPPILLLDEPTSGLDPNQAREVRDLLSELKRKKTVFVSTHILPEAEALADRVLIIHRGVIAAQGTPDELAGRSKRALLSLKQGTFKLAEAKAAIQELGDVEEVSYRATRTEGRFEIVPSRSGTDLREPLFKLAVDKGWTVLELSRQSANLEDVFHEITLS